VEDGKDISRASSSKKKKIRKTLPLKGRKIIIYTVDMSSKKKRKEVQKVPLLHLGEEGH